MIDGVTADNVKWQQGWETEKAVLSKVVGRGVQCLEPGQVYYALPR